MKTCTKCKITKEETEFNKNKSRKDGLYPQCRKCASDYRHSKHGLVSGIYGGQRHNSTRRGHQMPTYSKAELKDWLFSQPKFHVLYDNWKRLDYQKIYAPSVDRIDDSIGYTMVNIQLMTWIENNQKSHDDMRAGKLANSRTPHKPVVQLTKAGEFVAEYVSIQEAARRNSVDRRNISACCLGKAKSAYGFKWKLA